MRWFSVLVLDRRRYFEVKEKAEKLLNKTVLPFCSWLKHSVVVAGIAVLCPVPWYLQIKHLKRCDRCLFPLAKWRWPSASATFALFLPAWHNLLPYVHLKVIAFIFMSFIHFYCSWWWWSNSDVQVSGFSLLPSSIPFFVFDLGIT